MPRSGCDRRRLSDRSQDRGAAFGCAGLAASTSSALGTGLIVAAAALLAMGWVTTALAQADSDGDVFDGDELSVPILLGVGVLAYAGWLVYRRRAAKSRD